MRELTQTELVQCAGGWTLEGASREAGAAKARQHKLMFLTVLSRFT